MSTASIVTERVIYLALELSRSTWLAALCRPGAEKTVLHRLDGSYGWNWVTRLVRRRVDRLSL